MAGKTLTTAARSVKKKCQRAPLTHARHSQLSYVVLLGVLLSSTALSAEDEAQLAGTPVAKQFAKTLFLLIDDDTARW